MTMMMVMMNKTLKSKNEIYLARIASQYYVTNANHIKKIKINIELLM